MFTKKNNSFFPAASNYMLTGAFFSILLTLAAISTNNPIDIDGILYLDTAHAFLTQGISAAFAKYQWPAFSILVALISQATHLSLEHSAYLLNGILQIGIVIAFIALIKSMNATIIQLRFATLLILIYPFINTIRHYISRDFGYWAFALFGIYYLIQYTKNLRLKNAFGFAVAMAIATLFRIEGALLLLFMPLVLLFTTKGNFSHRSFLMMKVYILPLTIISVGTIILGLTHHMSAILESRLPELSTQAQQGLTLAIQNIHEHAQRFGQAMLIPEAVYNSHTILIGGLIAVLFAGLIKVVSPLYLLLSTHAIKMNLSPALRETKIILWTAIGLNIVIIVLFLAQKLFVADRYLVLFSLLFILFSPFSFSYLFEQWRNHGKGVTGKQWFFPLVCVILFCMALGGIVRFGHSKAYITEAGMWVNKNTSANIKLFSNSSQVLYYANRVNANWDKTASVSPSLTPIFNNSWHEYDYLAIRINHSEIGNEKKILEIIKLIPVKTFKNKRGDKVLIFHVPGRLH